MSDKLVVRKYFDSEKILQKAGGKSLHLVPVKTILKLQNKKLLTRLENIK